MESSPQTIERAAQRFLAVGKVNGIDGPVLADACNRFINRQASTSLKSALVSAKRFVRHAEGREGELPLTAYRALARITHMGGGYVDAESAYLKARRLASGDNRVKALIDRALIDVYMYLGNQNEARRRARLALKTFQNLKSESDVAKTRVNFGNLLHRQDRHREAEKLYRQAAEYFESVSDDLAVARCNYNRANTLVQLFEFDKAEPLYDLAEQTYAASDMQLDATDARYGKAWLQMLKGSFHTALRELGECERIYRESGQPKGAALCELDRAEVFLGLNLFIDARDSAKRSRQKFDKLGISYESSKASYFLARAEASLENPDSAIKALDRALEGFTAEKNAGFVGACYLLRAQLSEDSKEISGHLARARRGFAKAQLPLWEAIADLHLAASNTRNQAALIRLNKSGAVKRVPHLYAWWQTVLGDRAALKGSHASAVGHWTRAADRLDTVRAQLPPVEMRSHFGRQESSPHRKLIESTASADPITAAVWAERYQTAGVWAPVNPVLISDTARRRVEQSLNELAAQVASFSRALPGDSGERGGFSPQAQVTVNRLQQKVRRELADLEQTDGRIDEVAELRDKFGYMSQDMPIVQFHFGDSALYAFVHFNGKTRCCQYADGKRRIFRIVRQWRFLLERELLTHHLKSASDIASEERFFRSVGDWLWKPLEIPASAPRVLIIPQGDLANIPWEALIVDSLELGRHHHFTVTPSLRHFVRANEIESDSSDVDVFVGESSNLPAVTLELNALLASCGKSGRLHEPASRGAWPTTGGARLWHFAGHAHLRADNPFYSYLSLSDGPLFAADFRIRDVRVGLVTLAACRSGEQVALSGEESTGLVRSLLEMGARNVIAGRWPVSDISTAIWMSRFYRAFFEGESIAKAARLASQQVREKYPSAYHWAAFSVFGAGS